MQMKYWFSIILFIQFNAFAGAKNSMTLKFSSGTEGINHRIFAGQDFYIAIVIKNDCDRLIDFLN
jgi:hypothetical protein